MTVATTRNHQIRWTIRRDMPEIMAIENASFEYPNTEDDIIAMLRQRNYISMLVEHTKSGKILGFMIYELHKHRLHLVSLAVHPSHRRSGVGLAMIDKLKSKLSQQRRHTITTMVSETNLAAQLWLKANGFRYTRTVHQPYDEIDCDGYQMTYRLPT